MPNRIADLFLTMLPVIVGGGYLWMIYGYMGWHNNWPGATGFFKLAIHFPAIAMAMCFIAAVYEFVDSVRRRGW